MKKNLIQGFFGITLISFFFSLIIFSLNVKENGNLETKEIKKTCKVIFTINKDNEVINKTVDKGTCHE